VNPPSLLPPPPLPCFLALLRAGPSRQCQLAALDDRRSCRGAPLAPRSRVADVDRDRRLAAPLVDRRREEGARSGRPSRRAFSGSVLGGKTALRATGHFVGGHLLAGRRARSRRRGPGNGMSSRSSSWFGPRARRSAGLRSVRRMPFPARSSRRASRGTVVDDRLRDSSRITLSAPLAVAADRDVPDGLSSLMLLVLQKEAPARRLGPRPQCASAAHARLHVFWRGQRTVSDSAGLQHLLDGRRARARNASSIEDDRQRHVEVGRRTPLRPPAPASRADEKRVGRRKKNARRILPGALARRSAAGRSAQRWSIQRARRRRAREGCRALREERDADGLERAGLLEVVRPRPRARRVEAGSSQKRVSAAAVRGDSAWGREEAPVSREA